jgi:hypothetical protein
MAVQYDIRWSYVAWGCIDLFDVREAWFVLHHDTNYDATKVKEISYTAQRLKLF